MKQNDDARHQSYFGFSVAMLIQMLLTFISLIIVSTLYLSKSDNANDHLLLEIVYSGFSLLYCILLSFIFALAFRRKSIFDLRVFQISVIIYIVFLFIHCMRIVHSFMGGKLLNVYLYGFVYALISIVLLAFALFKTSEIRVTFAEEKRRKNEEGRKPTLRLSGIFTINTPPRAQSGYGSDTSYVTAREHPIE